MELTSYNTFKTFIYRKKRRGGRRPRGAIRLRSGPAQAVLRHFQPWRAAAGIWSHGTGGASPVTRNNRVRRPD